jgi:hypothetical protein
MLNPSVLGVDEITVSDNVMQAYSKGPKELRSGGGPLSADP